MDVIACAVLASVEAAVLPAAFGARRRLLWLALFVIQYVAIKCYRILLYPKYFSPLRHIPGPAVSLSCLFLVTRGLVDDGKRNKWLTCFVPCQGGHWLFGQFLNIATADSPHACYVEWMREYPDAPFIRYLSLFNSEVLMVNSPNAFKAVLQSQCYSFQKPDASVNA